MERTEEESKGELVDHREGPALSPGRDADEDLHALRVVKMDIYDEEGRKVGELVLEGFEDEFEEGDDEGFSITAQFWHGETLMGLVRAHDMWSAQSTSSSRTRALKAGFVPPERLQKQG